MIESFESKDQELREGGLAKVRRNLPQEVLEGLHPILKKNLNKNPVYRVLKIDKKDIADFVWLGPHDMLERDVKEFKPGMEKEDGRYQGVALARASELYPAHH